MARKYKALPVDTAFARENFADIIHEAAYDRRKFVIQRYGKPKVVMLSFKEFEKMMANHTKDKAQKRATKKRAKISRR